MYSVTWIENGQVFSISTPALRAAYRTFYNLRIRARRPARLWYAAKGQTSLIF